MCKAIFEAKARKDSAAALLRLGFFYLALHSTCTLNSNMPISTHCLVKKFRLAPLENLIAGRKLGD